MNTDTHKDCGGALVRAFPTTANYVRCTRCGHVLPVEVTR